MSRIKLRISGVAVFLSAIVFGMHVAGQTPQAVLPADASAPVAPVAPAQPGLPNFNGNLPVQPAQAGAPEGAADAINLLNTRGGDNTPDAIFKKIDNDNPPPPKPKAPPPFVPSDVETVITGQIKVGDPRAVLNTSLGPITIRLLSGYAPRTVKNFLELARGDRDFFDVKTGKAVRRPFYTNMIFHRVIADYLIQTGCPFGTGRGGPGYQIPDEITPILRFNKPGMVAMAPQRTDKGFQKDSNGSQFFISLAPMPDWDDKFTIFGEVERGMNVVERIAKSKAGPTDRPIKRIFLFNVDILDEAGANALKGKAE